MAAIYQFKITLRHSKPPIWRRVQIKSKSTFLELHNVIQVLFNWSDSHLHNFEFSRLPQTKSMELPERMRSISRLRVYIEQEEEVSEPEILLNPFEQKTLELVKVLESSAVSAEALENLQILKHIIGSWEGPSAVRTHYAETKEYLCDWFIKEKDRCLYTYDFGDNWEHEIVLEKILEPDAVLSYPLCIKGKEMPPIEDSLGYWEAEIDEDGSVVKYGNLKQQELDELNRSLRQLYQEQT